jgi:hypothetical protein
VIEEARCTYIAFVPLLAACDTSNGARCLRRFGLFTLAALAVLFIFFWWYALTPLTLRYRLTLMVDNNGQMVTGSSVIEASWTGLGERFRFLAELANGQQWTTTMRGEAVVVDLGSHGVLFALLRGDESRRASSLAGTPEAFVTRATGAFTRAGVTRESLERVIRNRPKVEVPFELLPLLVRFRDINDPKTVEPVDPNNLAASFGPGVKLVAATVEVTDDPLTIGIDRTLPWLPELRAEHSSLDGDVSMLRKIDAPLENQLGSGEFMHGDLK